MPSSRRKPTSVKPRKHSKGAHSVAKKPRKSPCPKGYILRKGYTRKSRSGKISRVKPDCIKATSSLGVKRAIINKLISKSVRRSQAIARKATRKISPKDCPKGYILRSAYIRKSKTGKTVIVPADCIKARGRSIKRGSKGKPLIGPMVTGALSQFGYHADLPISIRHKALKKAVKKYGALSVGRKLNAVYVLNRNTNPKIAKILKSDSLWVFNKYEKTI